LVKNKEAVMPVSDPVQFNGGIPSKAKEKPPGMRPMTLNDFSPGRLPYPLVLCSATVLLAI
jgi:hypothetical protein